MSIFSIERNPLDFILTDVLPNELPEIFTNMYFYNYLINNNHKLNEIKDELVEKKYGTICDKNIIFKWSWASQPYSFKIIKNDGDCRNISLMSPLAMLNAYFFVLIYKKSILNELQSPVYSIRYHIKNNKLYYRKTESKRLVTYIYKLPSKMKRRTIEQTGSFFKIKPYNSIVDFYKSSKWEDLCIKYKNLLKLDYKSCFYSIYTHTYNWTKVNNVNEALDVQKTNSLYPRIDQVMQNISGKITNGIIVGPEFSRMIAEILLQRIDENVYVRLNKYGYKRSVDYNIYRYVDDIFVFTNDSKVQDCILKTINEESSKLHLTLNSLKMEKFNLPIIESPWDQQMNILKELLNNIFVNSDSTNDDKYILKFNSKNIHDIERQIENMMVTYQDYKGRINRYILSILANKLSERKQDAYLFSKCLDLSSPNGQSQLFNLLNMIFKIYCYDITFESTQRLISILYSINYDVNFKNNNLVLQKVIDKYSRLFKPELINEYVNLLLVIPKYKVYFPINIETNIANYILESEKPLLLASLLIYSQYNKKYASEISSKIENIINLKIDLLQHRSKAQSSKNYMYDEIWYVLIFIHCKYLSTGMNAKIEKYLDDYCKDILDDNTHTPFKPANLIYDFLKNEKSAFITWSIDDFDLDRQIAYRTYYKTVFRNYSKYKYRIGTSI